MADSKQAANAETNPEDAFWRVADTFIGLANEQATEIDRGDVYKRQHLGRLRNSLRSNSPRRLPSVAQDEGAVKGIGGKL